MSKFLSLLPPVFQLDATVKEIATLLDTEIEAMEALTDKLLIYTNLETMSEAIVDELASSFHILPDEGYRFADTIEKKRELVRQAITLHRHKGTLFAVKQVLKILGINGTISEWFEYGGRPYYFKVDAHIGEGITENDITVLETLLNEFKNARSHIEGITFLIMAEGVQYYSSAILSGENIIINPYIPHEIVSGNKIYNCMASEIHEKIEVKPKT